MNLKLYSTGFLPDMNTLETDTGQLLCRCEDRAFAEKRDPEFTGRSGTF